MIFGWTVQAETNQNSITLFLLQTTVISTKKKTTILSTKNNQHFPEIISNTISPETTIILTTITSTKKNKKIWTKNDHNFDLEQPSLLPYFRLRTTKLFNQKRTRFWPHYSTINCHNFEQHFQHIFELKTDYNFD